MFTPIRFYEPRYHQSENNYYFGGPMMYPMMNQWDRMMFNVAKPFLISGMITNLSNTIADIIRGNKSGQNCNCGNSNYNMHSNNMYNYNDSLSAPLYPYVNLGNTHIEGKGGTENNNADTISKLESAYKEHGIKSIYKGDDGRYFAVTKDGKQLSALSLSDLSEEICKYINENKVSTPENTNVKPEENSNNVADSSSKSGVENSNNEAVSNSKSNDGKSSSGADDNVSDNTSKTSAVNKSNTNADKNGAEKEQTEGPKKYDNTANINYAVDKLHRGIQGDGLATVTPEHITDVLFNSTIFNKDSAVSILTAYKEKYGKELFEDIDSEYFYFDKSKVQDYLKIMEVLCERAKETVKDQNKLKLINDFYNKLKTISYTRFGNSIAYRPLFMNKDIDTFKQIMQILRDAEPKN